MIYIFILINMFYGIIISFMRYKYKKELRYSSYRYKWISIDEFPIPEDINN